ncbi:LuxR family maltose regulon positive regulatory protein [Sedimentibacter acidaminivorans]|uniref:LuxR family maltose regulon positive regulatory protein n=1 Tax=Sedimentibacter acidaminivorans TaxID=913099 RepID=A0ABS4GCB6_9FIRM|nr:LuxR C-terminal-related transcriptional regulator [Sedimentibacter acidaminivorans]MBP1925325.1 LuxR family maltose regulon positive regulatory protein [Sedimentibacter acidaminivorans]
MYKYHKILNRYNVNNELKEIMNYPLTIATAPMGYGKSTAVREFLSLNKIEHIWIPLNESAKNTGYFWSLLINRISEVNKKLGNILDGLGFPQDSMQKTRIMDTLISYSPDKDFILVLDDYQFSENDNLNGLLEMLAKQSIPNLHLVIISRYLLKIDLTELIVKNLVYKIDQNTFRFNDKDVQQYFSNMSISINKEKINQIQNIADGWVAALYLIYRGLYDGIPLENITAIQDLLKNALYEHYNSETKKALCALSVINNFTIELAVYSTGIESIRDIIDDLCRENAFIQLDLRTNTYTIHNVFRSFLKNEANKVGIDIKEICRNAGNWYLQKHDIDQAFYYLFLGEDYISMLKELERPSLYIKANDRPMMFYYFNSIPKTDKDNHPIAYLKFILMFIITGDKKLGIELLKQFENEMPYKNYKEQEELEIRAAIHLIKVFLSFNNLELMLQHTDSVLNLLKGNASIISSHQGPFSFGSPHLTYIYYKESGSFKKIAEMPLEKYAKASGGAGLGSEALCSAEYALETGDFNQVEVNALRTIYQARPKNQTSMVVCATFTIARLYLYQNKYQEALQMLNDLNDEVSSNIESILLNTYDLCLGYIYACTGDYEKIPSWIKKGDMSMNSLLMQGAVFSYVVYGKALILSKKWSKSEALCETFNSYFSIFNNQLGFLHNYIHLSIAVFKRGNIEKSIIWLKKALFIGQADNIVMPFAENGCNLLPILKYFNKCDEIDMEYISKLTLLCTNYSDIISKPSFHNNLLTSRETEILKLIAKGMSRSEISKKLFISTATVRTHIQNIYIKLEVNKKSDALSKASQFNII